MIVAWKPKLPLMNLVNFSKEQRSSLPLSVHYFGLLNVKVSFSKQTFIRSLVLSCRLLSPSMRSQHQPRQPVNQLPARVHQVHESIPHLPLLRSHSPNKYLITTTCQALVCLVGELIERHPKTASPFSHPIMQLGLDWGW